MKERKLQGPVRRLILILVSALVATYASPRSVAAEDATTAFVGVTVITTYGGPRLRDQTVIVRGDRIVAIGPSSRLKPPAGAVVLGRPGQIVAPGLADMHVHIAEPNDGVLYLANGVTTVRNMAGRPNSMALARRIEAGEVPGPHVYSSGPIIDGPQVDWDNPRAVRTPEAMRAAVEAHAGGSFVGVKLYENLTPEAFAEGVRAARARGLQVYAHVPFSMTLDAVLALRIDSIEHLTGFDRALAPGSHSDWDEERWTQAEPGRMAPLALRVARSGVWNIATLTTLRDAPCAFADIAAAEATPLYRYATPRVRALWRGQSDAASQGRNPRAACEMSRRAHQSRLAMLRALRSTGTPLLIGTDAPQPYVYPGFSLHDEFALHREAGFSPAALLGIATRDAARFLHREREFGVVAPGARADLLLLDHDPEADLATLRSPAGVMAAGRWYDAATLARMLDEVAERVRKPD